MRCFAGAIVIGSALLLAGCADQGPTDEQRTSAILADPMGYKPEVGRDITGGDITHVGNGMDKDFNDFLNP
jgi:hypothetical protein